MTCAGFSSKMDEEWMNMEEQISDLRPNSSKKPLGFLHLGVSWNEGTPKTDTYNGKSIYKIL